MSGVLLFERGHVFVSGVAMLLERGHVFVLGVAMLRKVMYLCQGVAMLLFEKGHVFV